MTQTTWIGNHRFAIRESDNVIIVTTHQGVPVDMIYPADRERAGDLVLAIFAAEWVTRNTPCPT